MLDSTLIVVLSEFGRTPNINHYYGRDHWRTAWSRRAWAAAEIRAARVIGKTNANGTAVADARSTTATCSTPTCKPSASTRPASSTSTAATCPSPTRPRLPSPKLLNLNRSQARLRSAPASERLDPRRVLCCQPNIARLFNGRTIGR